MKRTLIFTAILVLSITKMHAQDMHARVDSLMNFYVNEYNFNGVALVASKGDIIFEQSYGYRDIGKKIKHDDQSIFQVGMLTTEFTAELIFQLATENKLNLDDKIEKYFPKYPKGDTITIRNLLTNTSGILDYFIFDGYFMKHDTLHVAQDSLMQLFENKPTQVKPGTRFQYSNSNYLLLGYIIEKVTKKSYSQVLREKIFKPAGMTHSGLDYRGLRDAHKSSGYRHYSEDEKKLPPIDSTLTGGCGALYTTAADLYAWHKALQSYKLLNKKMQDSMYVPFIKSYAYAWYSDTINNKVAVLNGGMIQGFSAYLLRVPSEDLCIVILENINFPAYDNYSMSHKIAEAFLDDNFTMPAPVPVVSLSAGELAHYNGTYEFPSGVSLIVTTDGNGLHAHNVPLKGEQSHGNDFDMVPIGENKFKTKSLNAVIEFAGDGSGNVTKMVMHQPKHDIIAKKKMQ